MKKLIIRHKLSVVYGFEELLGKLDLM